MIRDVKYAREALLLLYAVGFTLGASAWMESWDPEFDCKPAKVRRISKAGVSEFYEKHKIELGCAEYTEGGALDLNGDGYCDFVYIVPWMGCGLNAWGYEVHFHVSNGTNEFTKSVMDGYGVGMEDLVKVNGKVYFRQSMFFGPFEKSQHNHWVYQVYSFDTNGMMRGANADFGGKFPAVTIYYENPRFKQIELTRADRKVIQKRSAPTVNR